MKFKFKKSSIVLSLSVLIIPLSIIVLNNKEYKIKIDNIAKQETNTIAMYTIDDNGTETKIDQMPDASEYEIDTSKSYCMRENQKLYNVLTNIDNNFVFTTLNKNDKCYVWFKKPKFLNKEIIAQSTGQQISSVNGPSCEESSINCGGDGTNMNQNGVYNTVDDYGTSYVYRGTVNNNWVKFGKMKTGDDIWWRIIRINGNETIRLIYAGIGDAAPSTTTDITQIPASAYNTNANDNKYVGFMYGTESNGTPTKEETLGTTTSSRDGSKPAHTNIYNSTIKEALETWWDTTNLESLMSKIDVETGFCNDRNSVASAHTSGRNTYSTNTYGKNTAGYAAMDRIMQSGNAIYATDQKPTLKCGTDTSKQYDLFTGPEAKGVEKDGKTITGNNKLTKPVGLITMDEVLYAGGFVDKGNTKYWLYTGQKYWTMSPFVFITDKAGVSRVDTTGQLNYTDVDIANGVRPVINLKANTKFTTTESENKGTTSSPYIVE